MMTEIKNIPVMPLRGLVIYPGMVLHLDVGRAKSIQALEKAMVEESKILLVAQKEVQTEDPDISDIYTYGTVARVRQMLKLPNDTIRVLVEGLHRALIHDFIDVGAFLTADFEYVEETNETHRDGSIDAYVISQV